MDVRKPHQVPLHIEDVVVIWRVSLLQRWCLSDAIYAPIVAPIPMDKQEAQSELSKFLKHIYLGGNVVGRIWEKSHGVKWDMDLIKECYIYA